MLCLGLLGSASAVTTAEDAVDWYGRIAIALEHGFGEGEVQNVTSNGSRVGVRAGYPVARGLRAVAQLEFSVDHASGLSVRESFGGIEGAFGTLRAGQFDTPLRELRDEVDLFDDQLGSARTVARNNGAAPGRERLQGFDERLPNSLHYRSPSLGPWGLDLQYALDIDGGQAALGAAVRYRAGAVLLGFGHERYRGSRSASRFIAAYQAGSWYLGMLLQQARLPDDRVWGFAIRYKPNRWDYGAQYYRLQAEAADFNAAMLALGIGYEISHSLRLYLNYVHLDNAEQQRICPLEECGSASVSSQQVEPTGGLVRALALGIRLNF
jgi:predicted porin